MIKQLVKHGDGWALPIDQPVLDQLQVDPQIPLELTTDGQTLVVAPVRDPGRRAKFEAALEAANRQYGAVLKKLAE